MTRLYSLLWAQLCLDVFPLARRSRRYRLAKPKRLRKRSRELSEFVGYKAVLTKDTAYLTSLWADDFSYIGADGTVRDEKANLALYEDDTNTVHKCGQYRLQCTRVRQELCGCTDGDNYVAGKDKDGKPFRTTWRWTTVWIRQRR